MLCHHCGSSLLLALPEDVFAIVTQSLSPRDICNLGSCCQNLYALASSDKIWFTQCDLMGVVPPLDLVEWRKGVASYKALCRFLVSVQPLLGIWVHQNPELGNVVYVMFGFISVVGCRIIPQELGPLGIEEGPILWAPVFEIIADSDGSATFFLHGREGENDYLYPGSLKPVDRMCNVLLLEVEPMQQRSGGKLVHSKSFAHYFEEESSRKISRPDSELSRLQRVVGRNAAPVPFSRLAFGDRRKLIEIVTSQIRLKVPDPANALIFPCLRGDEESFDQDMALLCDRRLLLIQLCKLGGDCIDQKGDPELYPDPTQLELSEIRNSLDRSSGFRSSLNSNDGHAQWTKRKTLGGYFRDGLKQILGKSSSIYGKSEIWRSGCSSNDNKHAQLHEFLQSGDMVALTLHASTLKLSSYRAWPSMHDSRFALYKLPLRAPKSGQEYAGLWGGTFGWPPGRPTTDKPGKALFFFLLSYEESQGQQLLIATKILEGTHYVLHPNGSAVFIVNVDEPSLEPFPWASDGDSLPVDVKHAFVGEGIANGYGFRYPGSKPGSLFVIQGGLLAFIWKESRVVLTLRRLNLTELLKKGERVPALPPIANFSYLTKSYSNVFVGFSNTSTCLSSPRFEIIRPYVNEYAVFSSLFLVLFWLVVG
ncbi:F-box protein At5g39450-like isoform X1 [Rhododendron vialii]|uniref:F-box protein At5g39450-like isoform X1 n=1 Tax=Rhododendron vialii TaxID=182163 RepID=UPI00265F677E|nr:F-box protein At5g39450-like isoform X1 [Rhododendron vialii]XP_058227723.1 F-box protein At5g39450-like isoform X1 [Rhododendron vialii]XP_058227724.1 F-box protein At5g39450-like isoform X1 [Rhododendron vialii]